MYVSDKLYTYISRFEVMHILINYVRAVTSLQLNMYPSLPFFGLDFHLLKIKYFRRKGHCSEPLEFFRISLNIKPNKGLQYKI
jgi:hypothetical protein